MGARLVAAFIVCFLLAGCSANDVSSKISTFEGTAMTVPYKVLVGYGKKTSNDSLVRSIIKDTFDEVDAIYNKWNPSSEISSINKAKGAEAIPLSPQLFQMLETAGRYFEKTGGVFDPTIEPLHKLWTEALKRGALPNETLVAEAERFVGWDKIALSEGFLTKPFDGTQFNLEGIAKGYAVDLLVERLNAAGFPNVFVEWGGEIRASGLHPEGRPWRVFISRLGDPDPSQALDILPIENCAVATSGDYLQHWSVGGNTYFHVFNPTTKQPLQVSRQSVASVTVIAPTCLEADVLATAAMLLPTVEEAKEWAKHQKGAQFWIFSRESLNQIR